jgi:hypothetical protein
MAMFTPAQKPRGLASRIFIEMVPGEAAGCVAGAKTDQQAMVMGVIQTCQSRPASEEQIPSV